MAAHKLNILSKDYVAIFFLSVYNYNSLFLLDFESGKIFTKSKDVQSYYL